MSGICRMMTFLYTVIQQKKNIPKPKQKSVSRHQNLMISMSDDMLTFEVRTVKRIKYTKVNNKPETFNITKNSGIFKIAIDMKYVNFYDFPVIILMNKFYL